MVAMNSPLQFFEVDVFSTGPFTGNPLAVIVGADALSTEEMQRIAAWTNFSETTFLLRPTEPAADYRVRIFTPVEEFPFAGHPTLGSARAWLAAGGVPARDDTLVQECGVGLVNVSRQGDALAFATPPLQKSGPLPEEEVQAIASAFALAPKEIIDAAWGDNGPGWRLIQVRDQDTLRRLRGPRDHKVGFVALTPDQPHAYEVRAFTTTFEDPVTGSLNGSMAQWLRERGLVPDTYTVAQGHNVGRAGEVHITDDGHDVWVGGQANIQVRGEIQV
ncbi:epimerase [Corynebacterium renale]|nr:epimerase [Corynebacterium renale]STD03238.1 epimerase [Corynebacterium renale]